MPRLTGVILQTTDWQVLFLPAGGGAARWLPRSEITIRAGDGTALKAEEAAAVRVRVNLQLPGWLMKRELLENKARVRK